MAVCTVAALAPVAARVVEAWMVRPYSTPCNHNREQRTGRMSSTRKLCDTSVTYTEHHRMAVAAAVEAARAARAVAVAMPD